MAAVDFHNRVEQLFIAYLGRPANSTELELYSNEYNSIVEWNAANPTQPKTFYNMNLSTYLLDNSAFKGSTNYGQVVEDMYTRLTGAAIPMDLYNVLVGRMMDGNWGVDKLAIKMLKATGLWAFEDGTYGKPPAFQFQATATQPAVTTDFTVSTAAHHASAQAKVEGAKLFTEQLDTPAENTALTTAQGAASATTWLAGVTDTAPATAESAAAGVAGATDASVGASGEIYMLTKGLDNVPGTSGNDTIIGSITAGAVGDDLNTLSALDVVNGGAGTDTLKIASSVAAIVLPNMSNVEVVEIEGTAGVTVNTSAVAGVTNLNVLKQGTAAVDATAAATTDITVTVKEDNAATSTLGNVIKGGKNVTVTGTDLGTAAGTNADTITVGGAGALAAAGDVVVNATGAASVAATDKTLSTINVTGGKTISVTQKATSDAAAAAADKAGATITQGAVNVTGNASTTTVTVKQDASVAEVLAVDAVAAKAATQEVTFNAIKKGDVVTLTFSAGNTLAFTASKDLTAAEVASAFANLASAANQGNAAASLGIYTDAGDTTGWSSGAVQTVSATQSKVVFSNATATPAAITVGIVGTGTVPVAGAVTNGVAAVTAKTGVLGVANGKVDIQDSGAGFIKTVTVDGYGASSVIGTTGATTVLETLNLSNSGLGFTGAKVSSAADITVAKTAATLALNLEKVGFSGYYNGDATTTTQAAAVTLTAAPTTLNVKSTGNNYVNLTAAATEALNVSGTGLLDASTTDLAGLKTVKVTETAGLKLNAAVNNTVTSVDTTGTTGTVTISIDGDKATYAGGAGVDNVTVTNASTAIDKAIDLGAGDDRLDLSATLAIDPASTVELKGGDGTDTIVLRADAAVARTGGVTFQDRISGFERLEVTAFAANSTVNLDNLDDINYVISNGSAAAAAPTAVVVAEKTPGAAGSPEVQTLTFSGLLAGQSYTVVGRTVTALQDATAAEVAAVFGTGTTTAKVAVSGGLAGWTAAAAVAAAVDITNSVNGDVALVTPSAAGGAGTLVLTLDKMLTGATVELKAAGNVEVKLGTDGTADVVNFVANAATGTTLGTATADKVETINIEAKDTDVTATATGTANVSTNTLVLDADAAKTVNLTGAGNLTLTLSTDSKEVTLIDGSTATGKLNVTTLAGDTAATTVKGGSAADTLVAKGANDVLIGGAGNDVLKVVGVAASAVTLTGGEGVDQFDVSGFLAASAGGAATITDLAKGETIKFASNANANFASSKVTLIGEATFDNYVTEAVKVAQAASGDGTGSYGIAWFQYNNNTFIVQDANIGGGAAGVWDNNNDIIVKITGAVDLSASSFNEVGQGTLLFI